jgi:hypothetical protein
VLTLAAAAAVAGCAGARRVTDGRTVVVAAKGYQIDPPLGWEPVASDADLALRQPAIEAGLLAHGTCEGKTPQRPLPVLARHLRFGLREVRDLDQAPVEVAGQRGVRSRFTARLDGVPVSVGAVTVEGKGCIYDLVVVAPPERFPTAAAAFERFAASFVLIGGAR